MPGIQDKRDLQGGKAFGAYLQKMNIDYDALNAEFLEEEEYEDHEDLAEKLELYKKQFIDADVDKSGDLGQMDLKILMEKLGQPKTQLELKKMISEVDTRNSGTINYADFIRLLLTRYSSVLQRVLLFENKRLEMENKGTPEKRDLSTLP